MKSAKNLDKTKLIGNVWYEYARYDESLPFPYICRRDTFKLESNDTLLFNTNVFRFVKVTTVRGFEFYYKNLTLSGKLVFRSKGKFRLTYDSKYTEKDESLLTMRKKFKVIYTNYDRFSFIWSCRNSGKGRCDQQLLVLTRDDRLSNVTRLEMESKLSELGLNITLLAMTAQDCTMLQPVTFDKANPEKER